MRNLKRALSLTLASVMLLGMMVVGTSAAAGYSDVDAEDNVEAIEVLQAVEVMVGDDRGFGPDRPVTRAEMAVVMGKLLSLDYDYYVSTCPFADVSGNFDWAKGWVGACAANGIVSGRGDGIYDPAATVTAVEAASMMMRALGYFRYQNDYNDGFVVSTVRQGTKIGIFNDVGSDGSTPMTRNQVAQMALNALKTGMVEPDGNTTTFLDPDGSIIATTGKVNYVYVTSSQTYATAISDASATSIGSTNLGAIVELGEQLYKGKLRLDSDERDVFGRPARQWDYQGEEIGTYAKKELLRKSYTVKVEGGEVYSDVGAAAAQKYPFYYWVNGVRMTAANEQAEQNKFERRNDDRVGTTGKGVLTEAYVDDTKDNEELTIVEIHTYLAYANNDYDERNDKLSINIYEDLEGVGTPGKATEVILTRSLSGADFAIEDYKQDDLMLVTFAGTKKEVQSIAAPELVADVYVNSYSTGTNDDDNNAYMMESITADGTKYDASYDAVWDPEYLYNYDTLSGNLQMKNHRYNLYLDQYGYVIGLENVKASTNYAFLVGYQPDADVLANTVDRALVILIDDETGTATLKTVRAQVKDLKNTDDGKQLFGAALATYKVGAINKWVTYSMDGDVMIIESAVDTQYWEDYTASKVIDKDHVTLEGGMLKAADNTYEAVPPTPSAPTPAIKYGNTKTVYVAVDADNSINPAGSIVDINGTSVGVRNTNIEFTAGTTDAKGAYVLYESGSGYIKYAVVVGENTGSQNFVYLTKLIKQADRDDENDKDVFIYEGFVNGVYSDRIESLVSWEGATKGGANLAEGIIYEAKVNSDGRITRMDAMADNWEDATQVDNRTDGYVQATSGTTTNSVTLGADTKLWLKDQTLYIHTDKSNDRYVQLDDNVKFHIRGTDEKGKLDSSYTTYSSAKSALNRLGAQQPDESYLFTGNFVAICDPATGYATAIIIKDTKFEALTTESYLLTYASVADISGLAVTKASGAAIASGSEVQAGSTVTVAATVTAGFTADVKVNGTSAGTISGTGSVTFTMPAQDSVITFVVSDDSKVSASNLDYNLNSTNKSGADKTTNVRVVTVHYSGATAPSLTQVVNDVCAKLGVTDPSKIDWATATAPIITVMDGMVPVYYKIDSATGIIASYKGTIDGNTVFVSQVDNGLDDVKTAESLAGTYVAGTGVTNSTTAVTQDSKTYYPMTSASTIGADGFALTTGYVAVSGDGISGSKIIPTNAPFPVPAKADVTGAKGTGMMYTVGGSGNTYVVYGGSIAASKLTDDIVLDQDYIAVNVALDATGMAGWTLGSGSTTYVSVAASQDITVVATKAGVTGSLQATGHTATVNAGVTSATYKSTGSSYADPTLTIIFTVDASAATGDTTLTVTAVSIS